jgi:hypothetical protein
MRAEAAPAAAVAINQTGFVDPVTSFAQRWQQSHLLNDIEAGAPDIEDVPSGP